MLKLKETLPVNSVRPRVILCHIMLTVTMRFLQYFIRNYLVCLKGFFVKIIKKKYRFDTHRSFTSTYFYYMTTKEKFNLLFV